MEFWFRVRREKRREEKRGRGKRETEARGIVNEPPYH
jgi:hypothetical protein